MSGSARVRDSFRAAKLLGAKQVASGQFDKLNYLAARRLSNLVIEMDEMQSALFVRVRARMSRPFIMDAPIGAQIGSDRLRSRSSGQLGANFNLDGKGGAAATKARMFARRLSATLHLTRLTTMYMPASRRRRR